jgi:zinc protease
MSSGYDRNGSERGRRPRGGRAAITAVGGALAAVLLLAAQLVATQPLAAQGSDPQAPTTEPQVLRATLDNGLRVVIVPNDLAPAATTVVSYLVGGEESPPGFPGMAHAEEHMMFRGNPGLSADELAAITAAMGGSFNANTQQTVTQYHFTVPAEDLDVALHVEALRMSGILDTEALWQQERGAIEQEVAQDLSSPEYVVYMKLLTALFKGTAYAHDALGTRQSFQETTGAMLKTFYTDWYAPNNAILVVAGKVDPPQILERVRRLFGAIPSRRLPARPQLDFQPVQAQTIQMDTSRPYATVMVAFRMPGSRDKDYPAVRVLADVLSSRRGPLYGLVVQGKALYAGFSLNEMPDASLGFAVAALPAGGDTVALATTLRGILAELKDRGVDPDLVAAERRKEVAAAEFQKNSIPGLAMAWSRALAVDGLSSPEAGVRAVAAVTPAQVNAAAGLYLDPAQAVTAVLTPKPSGTAVASRGFTGSESLAAAPEGPVALPSWASAALSRLSVPAPSARPVVSLLSNGITVIVQPEKISDTVSVFGHIQTNPYLQVPPGKEGLASLTDELFSYGTTSLDRGAFQKAVDDIGASVSAGSDFSLRVLSGELEQGLDLLADNELHPAFPEQAFRIVQRQSAAAVAGQLDSPDYHAGRALDKALLPAGDPGLREATPETIRGLTIEDVRGYYESAFRPDLTTVVVVGNVTPELALQAVKRHFASWEAKGPKPQVLLPPVPLNGPATVQVPDSSRVQDEVTLAQNIEVTLGDPDRYALELGNHVLGGAFYATRLYRDLREKEGIVYHVSSSFDFGRTRSDYSVEYACDPAQVSRARDIVLRDLKAMQIQPVSADELRQAKALLLREIPLGEASVRAVAGQLLYLSSHGLPLDEPIRAGKAYLSLTAADVQAAFARRLHLSDMVQVVQGPTPK